MKNLHFLLFITTSVLFYQKPCAQTVYQAEDADVIHLGILETKNEGFTGTGYVNGDNVVGSYIEWAVSMATAGEQTLTFFFANSTTDDRSMTLSINGTDITDISFPGTGAWTTYTSTSVNASLVEGLNVIRITANTANGGPNIDKLEVTGEAGPGYFTLDVNTQGEGTVNIDPIDDYYAYGSEVTLTAEPADTFFFAGWLRNTKSKDTSVTITIDSVNYMTAMFMRYNVIVKTNEKIGWCDYETETTGGEGGTITEVSSQSELESAVTGSTAKIIQINGTIEITPFGKEIDVSSNTTITGRGDSATLVGGGFRVINADNVIIQNLTFRDAYVSWDGKSTDNDALEINNSTHVWITHCDLSHFDDGLCDIKNGSDYVTVSWCHFHNHNKVMLIGSADDSPQDVGHLNVTVHDNWFDGRFDNGIGQRLPLGRYGKIHVFNNYYNDVLIRCVEAAYDGNIVVDNNYYLNSALPHVLVGGSGGGDNKMNASGNIYVNTGTRRDDNGQAFSPDEYYSYEYYETKNVPVIVMLGAGVNADTLLGRVDSAWIDTGSSSVIDFIPKDRNNYRLNVFPNPTGNLLNLEIILPENTNASIAIIDISGRQVYIQQFYNLKTGINNLKINTGNLTNGNYIVRLVCSDVVITKLIAVQ